MLDQRSFFRISVVEYRLPSCILNESELGLAAIERMRLLRACPVGSIANVLESQSTFSDSHPS